MIAKATSRILTRARRLLTHSHNVTTDAIESLVVTGSPRHFHCSQTKAKTVETQLGRQLQTKIRLNGPLTVADYMREVLTNPVAGYYMHRDVFGTRGDFITSPEISQMFGELLGIWCLHEWMQAGSPSSVQLVELGPGRGTLTDDILRCFTKFPDMKEAVSVHLVEVSPKLSEIQEQKLTGQDIANQSYDAEVPPGANSQTHTPGQRGEPPGDCSVHYKACTSMHGPDVFWYHQLQDVPSAFSFYIAHEFFDALPIHKFQRHDGRWHEVLVDVDDSAEGPHHLRLVLSKQPTVASSILLNVSGTEQRQHVEVSPDSGVLIQQLAERLRTDGGAALVADYGHCGEKEDTFRAFKDHSLWDPLSEPGRADLTADVDFSYLEQMAGAGVSLYGPVTQDSFLHNMGIGVRLQVLLQKATPEQQKDLITGYDMLTNHQKMGERFKFLAMMQQQVDGYTPAGFKALS